MINAKNVLLVGCEPATLGGEEGQMGLSKPVEAAVEEAVKLVESLIDRILSRRRTGGKTVRLSVRKGDDRGKTDRQENGKWNSATGTRCSCSAAWP